MNFIIIILFALIAIPALAYTPNAVNGPTTSTNNAIPRFSGVNGNVILNSSVAFDGTVSSLRTNVLIPFIDSGISTGTTSQTATLQADVDALVSQASTGTSTFGLNPIQIKPGVYTFNTGWNTRPWIQINIFGTTKFDFTGVSSGTLVRVYADDTPGGDPATHGSSAMGPFLNALSGSLLIKGPGIDTATTALDLGDSSGTGTPYTDFNGASIAGVQIQSVGTCINIRRHNTYNLAFIYGGHAEGCTNAITTETGTADNSGEKMAFKNWIFGTFTNGFNCTVGGVEYLFDNVSWDFGNHGAGGPALYADSTCINNHFRYVNNHFEGLEDGISTRIGGSITGLRLDIISGEYLGSSTLTAHGNSPRQAIFKGKQAVFIDGLRVLYANSWNSADTGMFMIDSNASILGISGIDFSGGAKQLTAAQLLVNDDPYFNGGTVGNDLITSPMTTWRETNQSNASAQVDNTHVWTVGGATQSIKITATGASGFYTIIGDCIKVKSGERLLMDVAAYGGASTGTDAIATTFKYTSTNAAISSVSSSTNSQSLSTIYGDTADPAYTGNRLWNAKEQGLLEATVPQGYDCAQPVLTLQSMNNGDIVWIIFAGVVKL